MFLFKYFLKQTEVTMETSDWWNGAELVHHFPVGYPFSHVSSSNSWHVALEAMAEQSTSGRFYSRQKTHGEDLTRKLITECLK